MLPSSLRAVVAALALRGLARREPCLTCRFCGCKTKFSKRAWGIAGLAASAAVVVAVVRLRSCSPSIVRCLLLRAGAAGVDTTPLRPRASIRGVRAALQMEMEVMALMAEAAVAAHGQPVGTWAIAATAPLLEYSVATCGRRVLAGTAAGQMVDLSTLALTGGQVEAQPTRGRTAAAVVAADGAAVAVAAFAASAAAAAVAAATSTRVQRLQ